MCARGLTGEAQGLFNAGNGDPLVLLGPDSCSVRNALTKRDAARLLESLSWRSCEILRREEIAHRAGVGKQRYQSGPVAGRGIVDGEAPSSVFGHIGTMRCCQTLAACFSANRVPSL